MFQKQGEGKNNDKKAMFIRTILSWQSPDTSDIASMYERFERYLNLCEELEMPIGNMAAYFALGISQQTASDWELGHRTPEHSELIKQVKKVCAVSRELSMSDGSLDKVTGIWWQKNFDGLKDVTEVVHSHTDMLGESKSMEQIAKDIPVLEVLDKTQDPEKIIKIYPREENTP